MALKRTLLISHGLVSLLTLKGRILMKAATVSHFLSLFLPSSIGRKIAAFQKIAAFLAESLSSHIY